MTTPEKYHGENNIEFTTQLIASSYSLSYEESREWAIKALDSLDSHGSSASDHGAVKKVVDVVVASWLGKNPRA
jgi:oligoendopeptidase F